MKNRLKILGNRTMGILTILTLLTYIFINIINTNTVYAAQTRETYDSNKIAKYPGYKELIEKVKAAHPNWNIKIHYTNLDWNTVLYNETTETHTRSLVPINSISSWICPECGTKPQDSGSWVCASEGIVAYMMDPRNWINEDYIFQFENLAFNETTQTLSGVQAITSRIGYMSGNTVTYTTTNGTTATINKSYAQIIYEAAKEAGISPYHLASRIRQEQGAGEAASSTASGTYAGYVGYYNFLNIGATGGNGDKQLTIINGLKKAVEKGWTNPEISIKSGAKELASSYINIGQDTLYLQKYDVDDRGSMFYHQYMQNIFAPKSESLTMRDTYVKLGFLNNAIEFIIPVYENMPSTRCIEPGSEYIVTQNAQIKAGHTNVCVRENAGTSYNCLRTINAGEKFLRIEIGTTFIGNNKWDKIVLSDGTKGYIATDYVEQINDIITCNETVKLTGSDVSLRNGPGTAGTVVKEYLSKGQIVTRIEKNKYNLDGLYWDRVITSSGLDGYVASNYLEVVATNDRFKIEEKNLTCEPYTSVENIKAQHSNAVIKKANGEVITTGQIGTGFTVTIDNSTYTVVKYGDINGDGKLNSGDSLTLSKQVLGKIRLTDAYILKAADINKDGKINSGDTLILRKQILGTQNISI